MGRVTCLSFVAGLIVLALAAPAREASAQPQAQGAMRVGATVAPRCTISVDTSVVADDRNPSVRVVCSRSGLRKLRVTTSRGDNVQPTTTFAGAQLQAGGEVAFVIPVVLATVAGSLPVFAPPAPPDRRPLTLTLDF
jgi:hypothetical protein